MSGPPQAREDPSACDDAQARRCASLCCGRGHSPPSPACWASRGTAERHFEEYEELGQGQEGFEGPSADVYSLGCVAFFLLRGHVPYDWEMAMHRDRAAGDQKDSCALSIASRARAVATALPPNDHASLPEHANDRATVATVRLPVATVARLKANDPFGAPSGGDYFGVLYESDDDEEEPEEATLSAHVVEFVRRATRYEASERPSAHALAGDAWITCMPPAETGGTAALEKALGQLGLE